MSHFHIAYAAAWAVAVVGVVAGGLSGYGHFTATPPSWLTSDVQSTAAIVMGICGGLAVLLPQLQRTPAKREARYLAAVAGVLPKDIAGRYPHVLVKH